MQELTNDELAPRSFMFKKLYNVWQRGRHPNLEAILDGMLANELVNEQDAGNEETEHE